VNQRIWDHTNRYVLIFDGEIFNHLELKNKLINLGYNLATNSTLEIILYFLIHYDVEALESFNGVFALAFYDTVEDKLILARDRFGSKQLYYYFDKNSFYFASDIKTLRYINLPLNWDYSSLTLYFFLTYIPSPFSAFEGVNKLLPAHYLIYNGRDIMIKKYYELPEQIDDVNEIKECIDSIDFLLKQSIEQRLNIDLPIGTFLSGGIDSSIITYLAHEFRPDITAYTISFPDLPYYDESDIAKQFALDNNISHQIIPIVENDLINSISNVLYCMDEPFADSSIIALYSLVEAIKPQAEIMLTGDGADELFGGYNKYRAWARLHKRNFLNSLIISLVNTIPFHIYDTSIYLCNKLRQLQRFSKAYQLTDFDRYFYLSSMNDVFFVQKILNPELLNDKSFKEKIDFLKNIYYNENKNILSIDFKFVLEGDMLRKIDFVSSDNNVLLRSPFLDYRLVDNVFKIPESYKFNAKTNKILLRDLYKNILPDYIINRPKHGFEVPIRKWMNDFLLDDLIKKGLNVNLKPLLNDNVIKNQNKLYKFANKSERLFYTLYVLNDKFK
ncbi:MAG: asparagine synthase (glutamine-hydrolyzing), partial [Bacteroidales bacterium]